MLTRSVGWLGHSQSTFCILLTVTLADHQVRLVRAILGGFVILGLVITAWRIYFRLRIGRFWWEDAWATAALLTSIAWLAAEWIDSDNEIQKQIIEAWIYSLTFTSIVMMVRMSILCSIIRLASRGSSVFRSTLYFAAFMMSSWVILITLKIYQCTSSLDWHRNPIANGEPFCTPEAQAAIFEVTTDFISVTTLVVLPLCMLWNVKLPPRQRRMILSIFASSIILAFASLFHAIGQRFFDFLFMTTGLNIEVVLSLFICNLLVVVTFTCRYVLPGRTRSGVIVQDAISTDDDDDDFTRPTRWIQTSTAISLTTIDLESDSISHRTSNQASTDHPVRESPPLSP